ncbi:MAG: Grx4 family monothiol glutaredoxin [Alphaproteobacteria bacterium]|nr:Grx4 family monothiol glutaredoxin [Alphaproteobacteria bacterium]
MGIFNRVKRKLPVVGGGSGSPSTPPGAKAQPGPARPQAATPPPRPASAAPAGGRGDKAVDEFLAEFVQSKPVVLFMKGSPQMPMCGFSANAAGILLSYGVDLASFDVLSDPEVRQGIKDFSQWPTIPQIYIGGEFVGGSDILMQMHQSGELKEMLDELAAG